MDERSGRTVKGASGFTVIELMIVVVVTAVLASIIGPTFEEYFTKQRLRQAVEDIQGMMMEAKTEAIVRGTDMYFDVDTAGTWCVGYRATAGCDCTATSGGDLCSIDAIISSGTVAITKRLSGDDYADVTMTYSNSTNMPYFDAVNSTMPPGNIGTFNLESGQWKAQVSLSLLGRVRICDNSTVNTLGYSDC